MFSNMRKDEKIALAAGFLTTFALLPQNIKIFITGNTAGISEWMYLMMLVGLCLWLYYAIEVKNRSVILWNVLSILLLVPILGMTVYNNHF